MDIDSLSMELIKALKGTAGSKGHSGVSNLPPKLKGKFHSWMKHFLHSRMSDLTDTQKAEAYQQFKSELLNKFEIHSPLSKNEMGLTTHKNGVVKMEFGSEVPEDVKKAAISWAKRRGLAPVDMKLSKSKDSTVSHVFSSGLSTSPDQVLDQFRWSF